MSHHPLPRLIIYFFSLKHHHDNTIVVGNVHMILIRSYGHAQSHPSLYLDNVLYAPKLIKKLIFVSKFTTDNNESVEFDHLGFFFVKALSIRNQILRCNSTFDLSIYLHLWNTTYHLFPLYVLF